jgi:hypothetical protein
MKIIERPNIPRMPNGPERHEVSLVTKLWKEYGFPGEPPRDGSVASDRLIGVCKQYTALVRVRESSPSRTLADIDPENFRPQEKLEAFAERQMKSSDEAQRDLHNQISIMIFGEARSGMNERTAMDISKFASELTAGMPSSTP